MSSKEPLEPLFDKDTQGDELVFAEENDDALVFAEEDTEEEELPQDSWKVLVVDDETEVHRVTQMALENFTFEHKPLTFISAYSGEEAKCLIQAHPDTALILLDVVMETDHSGLEFAKYIREELKNQLVRIVLRTGQPGQAPEEKVMIDYDINDYKAKTELTAQKLFTTMISALRSHRDLLTIEENRKELQQLVDATARFVPYEFLSFLEKQSLVDVQLSDHVELDMTILVSDIHAFTTLSENMTPKENFEFINSYFQRVGPIIRKNNGFVCKYTGDGMMALFATCVNDAVKASVETLKELLLYNTHRKEHGEKPIHVGIGLHSGSVILGTVGEEKRMQGDVMSDAANLADRLEGLTRLYGASIVLSEQTFKRLDDSNQYNHRFLGKVQVVGRAAPVPVFEICDGDSEAAVEVKMKTRSEYEEGITLFYNRKFAEASVFFNNVLSINPQDKAAKRYLERCAQFMVAGVPDDWVGVESLTEK
ncbi:response regulator [Candidatus Poribacteria bacterium]|nr:response regulator [Candidatus Poribacteria bacterium]